MPANDHPSVSTARPPLPRFSGALDILPGLAPRRGVTHVVFDFDGTLSWVRHGWPEIMFSVLDRHWQPMPGDTVDSKRSVMNSIVFGMNGRPTVVQMQRFAELMNERAGIAIDPEMLRREFQDRLDAEITARLDSIRTQRAAPDDFVIFGGRRLLDHLQRLGLNLVVLSSTIEHRVREEAEALGIAAYFGRHIHGSGANPAGFSKMTVLQQLLREEQITGANLLSFGDGPVEISCTKELGGLAVAVCSDEEHNGSGKMDDFKRQQLLAAGADAALPDYRDAIALMDYLLER
ncbi:MAG: HAD family hydrolase [Chthoniobacteraceae bacterium]